MTRAAIDRFQTDPKRVFIVGLSVFSRPSASAITGVPAPSLVPLNR